MELYHAAHGWFVNKFFSVRDMLVWVLFFIIWILECIYPCGSCRQQQQPKQSTLQRPEYNMPRWPPQKLDAVRDLDHLKCTLVSNQCRELTTDFGYKQRNFACLKMCLLFHTRGRYAKNVLKLKQNIFWYSALEKIEMKSLWSFS